MAPMAVPVAEMHQGEKHQHDDPETVLLQPFHGEDPSSGDGSEVGEKAMKGG